MKNSVYWLYRKEIVYILVIISLSACSGLPMSPTKVGNLNLDPGRNSTALSSQGNFITQISGTNTVSAPAPSLTFTPPASAVSKKPPNLVTTASPTQADFWMSTPVVPTVSQTVRDIYAKGIKLGRDPHAFSKIGDCQSISTYFLSYFDREGFYDLGSFSSLKETIDWFAGSFSRDSLAVKGGFNAAAILSPLRADPKQCDPDENPIACEFRVHNPSIALISLEEWWAGHPENYEGYIRQILEFTIQQGVIPIIATKADNLEGNHLINQTIARLALEYDIPLWNFWRAVQSLPNHGLIQYDSSGETDMFHLTHSRGYYFYNDANAAQSGWSTRNLTALQVLDAVRRVLADQQQ